MGFHRLRSQIIRRMFFALFLTTIMMIAGGALIYVFTTDAEEAIEFTDYAVENIPEDIHDIRDIGDWSGWENMNPEWKIIVFDEEGGVAYSNDKYVIMKSIWITTERDLEELGATLVVKSITGKNTTVYMDILRIVGWFAFFGIFALLFRKIEKYTYEIADGISILAGGEMRHEIPIRGKNELTMIASNINGMAEALHERMEEKRRSDKERDDLITNLAHDVRTPITILEGYLSILIKNENISKEKQKEYLEISLNKCHELSRRADNIFEYVRLNNKREELDYSLTYAKSYITNQFEEMSMILASEGFKFDVDIKLDQDNNIKIDTAITQRVFDNLLSNIIKYADADSPVYLKAYIQNDDVVVAIKNKSKSRITIEPERLFHRTVSGDLSRNGKSEGLGLSICKLIMEMQGGKIDVDLYGNDIEFSLYFLR